MPNSLKLPSKIKRIVFISPHLDDAVLSCGSLLDYLAEKSYRIDVISLFTQPTSPPLTKFVRNNLKQANFKDSYQFFLQFRQEDIKANKLLKTKPVHLKYVDAAWRKFDQPTLIQSLLNILLPQLVYIYPNATSIFSSSIHSADNQLIKQLTKRLNQIIPHRCVVFAPIGIGNHVDHQIANKITLRLNRPLTYYWEDTPYRKYYSKNKLKELFLKKYRLDFTIPFNNRKKQALNYYKSQHYFIDQKKNIDNNPEKYYRLKS